MVLVWLVISGIQLAMTILMTFMVLVVAGMIGQMTPPDDSNPRTGIDEYGRSGNDMIMDTLYANLLDENTRTEVANHDVDEAKIMEIFTVALWAMATMFIIIDGKLN